MQAYLVCSWIDRGDGVELATKDLAHGQFTKQMNTSDEPAAADPDDLDDISVPTDGEILAMVDAGLGPDPDPDLRKSAC